MSIVNVYWEWQVGLQHQALPLTYIPPVFFNIYIYFKPCCKDWYASDTWASVTNSALKVRHICPSSDRFML